MICRPIIISSESEKASGVNDGLQVPVFFFHHSSFFSISGPTGRFTGSFTLHDLAAHSIFASFSFPEDRPGQTIGIDLLPDSDGEAHIRVMGIENAHVAEEGLRFVVLFEEADSALCRPPG